MFDIPIKVLAETTSDALEHERSRSASWRSERASVRDSEVTDGLLTDLAAAAEKAGDKSYLRVITSIQKARSGDFGSIPRLAAAPEVLTSFLKHDIIDGWLYIKSQDGHFYPYLVEKISIDTSRDDRDYLSIRLVADSAPNKKPKVSKTLQFEANEVVRKKPDAILLSAGAYKETKELREEYDATRARFEKIVNDGFAQQYRFTGRATTEDWRAENERSNARVIHDLHPSEIAPLREFGPSVLIDEKGGEQGVGAIPLHPNLPMFDLGVHDFITVHTDDLTEHVYDKTLREKIILPEDQRELLDILTSDIETFTSDIIEGKSAGNVILAKGTPGVGKTLTAEVYSELIERPLYSIHSGNLGTDAASIRKNLEEVFKRAKRWDAVLLLDEADVFVLERGNDIQQNAIVAEFLRTLEYFDGLMFMTTNRASDIDDAIISRCAAIIDYKVPGAEDARRIWKVQADNNGVVIPKDVLDGLVEGFSSISPRDIKMLLRLALRVSAHRGEPLSVPLFRRCAMFRGLHLEER